MRNILVDRYPLGITFATPEAAIQHGLGYPPLKRARADESLVKGSLIIDGYWNDSEFVIRFANNYYLHIFVAVSVPGALVDWCLLKEEPRIRDMPIERVGAESLCLCFSNGSHFIMNRSAMFAQRRGKALRSFFCE